MDIRRGLQKIPAMRPNCVLLGLTASSVLVRPVFWSYPAFKVLAAIGCRKGTQDTFQFSIHAPQRLAEHSPHPTLSQGICACTKDHQTKRALREDLHRSFNKPSVDDGPSDYHSHRNAMCQAPET